MCNRKLGSDIKTEAELQNLVTGLIYEQKEIFSREEIVELAENQSKGSPLLSNEEKLAKMVQQTLIALVANRLLLYSKKTYAFADMQRA